MSTPRGRLRPEAERYFEPHIDEAMARRNNRLGWALFGLVLLLAVGTVLVALIYLAVD